MCPSRHQKATLLHLLPCSRFGRSAKTSRLAVERSICWRSSSPSAQLCLPSLVRFGLLWKIIGERYHEMQNRRKKIETYVSFVDSSLLFKGRAYGSTIKKDKVTDAQNMSDWEEEEICAVGNPSFLSCGPCGGVLKPKKKKVVQRRLHVHASLLYRYPPASKDK